MMEYTRLVGTPQGRNITTKNEIAIPHNRRKR
jgi:hypothetical protein